MHSHRCERVVIRYPLPLAVLLLTLPVPVLSQIGLLHVRLTD